MGVRRRLPHSLRTALDWADWTKKKKKKLERVVSVSRGVCGLLAPWLVKIVFFFFLDTLEFVSWKS